MEMDALDAGVFGGLTTKENIKLLICYIIHNMPEPLDCNRFCDEMHAEGIANYFETAEAVADLTKKELIVEDSKKKGCYNLTKKGLDTINALKENIPAPIRRRAYIATVKMVKKYKYREQTKVNIETINDNEVILSCSVMEGEKEMMTVRLNMPSFEAARNAKNIFWDSPETVYTGILRLMTHENIKYEEEEIEFIDK